MLFYPLTIYSYSEYCDVNTVPNNFLRGVLHNILSGIYIPDLMRYSVNIFFPGVEISQSGGSSPTPSTEWGCFLETEENSIISSVTWKWLMSAFESKEKIRLTMSTHSRHISRKRNENFWGSVDIIIIKLIWRIFWE